MSINLLNFILKSYSFYDSQELINTLLLVSSKLSFDSLIESTIMSENFNALKLLIMDDNFNEIRSTTDLNTKIYIDHTILTVCIKYKLYDLVKYLLKDLHINPNIPNKLSFYPLHIACFNGQLDIVKLLIEHGANPNIKANNNITPLENSILREFHEISQYLIEHGADEKLCEKRDCMICRESHTNEHKINYVCKICKSYYNIECLSQWQTFIKINICAVCRQYTPGVDKYIRQKNKLIRIGNLTYEITSEEEMSDELSELLSN